MNAPNKQMDACNPDTRHQREAGFHDKWAHSIDLNQIEVGEAFESPTALENAYILDLFGQLQGSTILDLGCGLGDASVYLAGRGATVCASDLSLGMVEVAHRLAAMHNVSQLVRAEQAAAEALPYADGSFDMVYGNGILHHVDVMQTCNEVFRVLKPGGVAAFVEPLSYNPAIAVYRLLARSVRTKDEHPLSAKDVRRICSSYSANPGEFRWRESQHREFQLFTLLIMVWFLVGEGILPSQERYWKRFWEQGWRYASAFEFLHSLDRFLYRHLPISRWLSWNTVITLKK